MPEPGTTLIAVISKPNPVGHALVGVFSSEEKALEFARKWPPHVQQRFMFQQMQLDVHSTEVYAYVPPAPPIEEEKA